MCDFIFVPIFCGTWNQVKSLGPELIPCPRCHNTTIRSINRRTWMTLYCVPIVPISRRRNLYHCDICRWEGVPVARVHINDERSRQPGERRGTRSRDLQEPQNDASSSIRAAAAVDALQDNAASTSARDASNTQQFQPVSYSQGEYENPPPPPYTESPPANAAGAKANKNANRHYSE
ncbi:hypothetical protein IW140_001399 [Coemansia sp. RSA 1813]|nr:hypothetical protein EV178_001045 [Coemansia sp. RSA 1646]KAJ1772214.1 hypothetical protein LPJ74_001644 [Coemansia sp. RSA 1843]KAJ2091846.1 hypothetical protein IW138_001535 [Coemansia sp. RSA 986]KAJ2215827.1 hypothetical protein EV179_001847 [Coemansia sp. RSA 487]KAJ2571758.1 hypothetical protein IW140_001399 [Coemansia sp. RSA 1813]